MNQSALDTWKQKLAYLQAQEAIAADPSVKFNLKKEIEECQQKIKLLEHPRARSKILALFVSLASVTVLASIASHLLIKSPLSELPTRYHDPKYQISMNYPKTWDKVPISGDWEDSGNIVKFLPKGSDSLDTQVTISLNEYPITLPSLEEVVAQVTEPLKADQILKNTRVLLAGQEAYLLEYKWTDATQQNLRVRQILMFKGDSLYSIAYTAKETEFNKFLPIVQDQMIESFQITSSAK